MKFIADNMLGKLAKWLRFMGYDDLYPKSLADRELAQLSIKEDRYLLTRDKNLANMKKIKTLYIQSDNLDKQLKQVINEFNLQLNSKIFSRCPECNFLIKEVDITQVHNKVPKGVFEQ